MEIICVTYCIILQIKPDKTENQTVSVPDESNNERSDTSASETSSEGTPVAKAISTGKAEISDKVCSTNADNSTKHNVNDGKKSKAEVCKNDDESGCKRSEVSEVKETSDLDNSENVEGNQTVVSVRHKRQKLLINESDTKCSSSDESDTTFNNEEGDGSKCENDSRSLMKSDIEADILDGKKKVLRKIKIKEEPMDSSSYSVDEAVVKDEPKEENSMSTSYEPEEYDPTFVVKTDWYTICTQSQAGQDRGNH